MLAGIGVGLLVVCTAGNSDGSSWVDKMTDSGMKAAHDSMSLEDFMSSLNPGSLRLSEEDKNKLQQGMAGVHMPGTAGVLPASAPAATAAPVAPAKPDSPLLHPDAKAVAEALSHLITTTTTTTSTTITTTTTTLFDYHSTTLEDHSSNSSSDHSGISSLNQSSNSSIDHSNFSSADHSNASLEHRNQSGMPESSDVNSSDQGLTELSAVNPSDEGNRTDLPQASSDLPQESDKLSNASTSGNHSDLSELWSVHQAADKEVASQAPALLAVLALVGVVFAVAFGVRTSGSWSGRTLHLQRDGSIDFELGYYSAE